jgi:MFS family permease
VQAGARGASTTVLGTGALGFLALVGFVLLERRSAHPMLPLELFASPAFSATNLVTLAVYAALGGIFFLLVLALQVVGGFSPLQAGTALLPVTVLMLLLSVPAGEFARRFGPRLPMAIGPLVSAAGALLMLRIGPAAAYVADVLPGVSVFGLGLAICVAPLTATVLAAVEPRHAGIASGVNNAVARTAALLAVAVLPLVAGISGDDYREPAALAGGFRIALWFCAALLALGGILAATMIRGNVLANSHTRVPTTKPATNHPHCAIAGPPLATGDDPSRAERAT